MEVAGGKCLQNGGGHEVRCVGRWWAIWAELVAVGDISKGGNGGGSGGGMALLEGECPLLARRNLRRRQLGSSWHGGRLGLHSNGSRLQPSAAMSVLRLVIAAGRPSSISL
ncbi:hypothetical protein Vafri_19235 [Volvox africanus]|uniref:Uncharacterized protein n=1 Tax=Volvox africanus TaxID=51714 RepID=A0A8J4FC23_9CHLO|nr:hypothetical protein Vafri_19235 [Volvox africanus]